MNYPLRTKIVIGGGKGEGGGRDNFRKEKKLLLTTMYKLQNKNVNEKKRGCIKYYTMKRK